jgi:hypothetical protein
MRVLLPLLGRRLRAKWIFPTLHLCLIAALWVSYQRWELLDRLLGWLLEHVFWLMMAVDFPWSVLFLGIAWSHSDWNWILLGNAVVGTIWWFFLGWLVDRKFF